MKQILLFAGTTEGRQILELLRRFPVKVYVSVATEYGRTMAGCCENAEVIHGRMNREEIASFLRREPIFLVLDATHPFACLATEHIRSACKDAGIPYIRCLREKTGETAGRKAAAEVDSVEEAVEYLRHTEGNILIATGSKELHKYTELPDYRSRCYARVLSTKEAVEISVGLGFEGKHLLAMQGPFSVEMNVAAIRHVDAAFFVTKDSGVSGGFPEKLAAAHKTGTKLVVVRRPREEGVKIEELYDLLADLLQ